MIQFYKLLEVSEYDESPLNEVKLKEYGIDKNHIENRFTQVQNTLKCQSHVRVFMVETEKLWTNLCQLYEIPEWACGVSLFENVFVKRKSLWSTFNVGSLDETILHESVHSLLAGLFGTNLPIWLNEGLAIYLSGQSKYYRLLTFENADISKLTYADENLYDLSISKLLKMLESQSIEAILQPFQKGGENYETLN